MSGDLLVRGMGYRPDQLDSRDWSSESLGTPTRVPSSGSMRGHVLDVLDQGRTSSCVAQACAQAVRMGWSIKGEDPILISRQDVYYRARRKFGGIVLDEGSFPRLAWKALQEGFVPEESWPFQTNSGINAPTPFGVLRDSFTQRRVLDYYRCPDDERRVIAIRAQLAALHPVCVGLRLDEQFRRLGPGHEPWRLWGQPIGRHYVTLYGWNDAGGYFEGVNSWGTAWGEGGFFRVSYEQVADPWNTTDCIALIIS